MALLLSEAIFMAPTLTLGYLSHSLISIYKPKINGQLHIRLSYGVAIFMARHLIGLLSFGL